MNTNEWVSQLPIDESSLVSRLEKIAAEENSAGQDVETPVKSIDLGAIHADEISDAFVPNINLNAVLEPLDEYKYFVSFFMTFEKDDGETMMTIHNDWVETPDPISTFDDIQSVEIQMAAKYKAKSLALINWRRIE